MNNLFVRRNLLDNSIDKRTNHGKRIVDIVKSMDKDAMKKFSDENNIAPELVGLRLKDIDEFLFNINQN